MSLRPTRPGEPGFQDWKDLADAVDSVGVLGAGCAEADPHEVEREAFYSSLGAYFLPDGSPRLEGDDDSACAQNRGTNTMNTPEFDFTAEQPNRLFEKWWAEQAEYRHRQTGISEARAIWLCSWRAYGEACRAATPAPEGMRLVPVEPTEEMLDKGAMEIAMNMQRVMTAERKAEHVYRAMLAASPVPPAPATGSVLTDEQIDKFAVQFLSASAPTRNAYDVRRFARAILAAKGETS